MNEPTPNLAQLVESAYHWETGDLDRCELIDLSGHPQPEPGWAGDGLLEFIMRETAPDGVEPNSVQHAAQALQRMLTVQREVASVVEALSSLRIVLKPSVEQEVCEACGRPINALHTADCPIALEQDGEL